MLASFLIVMFMVCLYRGEPFKLEEGSISRYDNVKELVFISGGGWTGEWGTLAAGLRLTELGRGSEETPHL